MGRASAERGIDFLTASGCWVLSIGLLLVMSLISSGTAEINVPDLGTSPWWWGAAILTVQAAVLVWRRALAVPVVMAVSAAAPIAALLGLGDGTGATSTAVIVAVYTLAARDSMASVAPALAVSGVLVGLGEFIRATDTGATTSGALGSSLLQVIGVLGVPLIAAAVVRSRRDTRQAKENESRALFGEQHAIVQAALARERLTMARELHDIAAHHLSGMAVLTAAIGPQIDADPEGAKAAVLLVREQSKAMLRDLRRLVGLLREEDSGTGAASVVATQNLDSVAQLVDDARQSGMAVSLDIHHPDSGRLEGNLVGPLAQLAAFRMVQESLANAARHAPGADCEVVITIGNQSVLIITVRNAAPPAPSPVGRADGGGLGLIGMRERAELTDAELEYGPTADGGWLVSWRVAFLDPAAHSQEDPR